MQALAGGLYFCPAMAKKWIYTLLFWVIETLIICGSVVVVLCAYLPFVALKGAWQTLTGKARPRLPASPQAPHPSGG